MAQDKTCPLLFYGQFFLWWNTWSLEQILQLYNWNDLYHLYHSEYERKQNILASHSQKQNYSTFVWNFGIRTQTLDPKTLFIWLRYLCQNCMRIKTHIVFMLKIYLLRNRTIWKPHVWRPQRIVRIIIFVLIYISGHNHIL